MAAVSPDGDVWPCVLSRWMRAGNVRERSLAEILRGSTMRDLVATVPGPCSAQCAPDNGSCKPHGQTCSPSFCNPEKGL
ncbi:MAG: SPASM domain-containing protein [Streptosporangiaceae bacterium]